MYALSAEEKEQIQARGSALNQIEGQLQDFEKGFPFLKIVRPATINDGIIRLPEEKVHHYSSQYKTLAAQKSLMKFVPASGAATRMFKELYEYLATDKLNDGTRRFVEGIGAESFAFHEELSNGLIKKGLSLRKLLESKDYKPIVSTLLKEDGLNYGSLPKGLLSFHPGNKTPLEEHLVEGAKYAAQSDDQIKLHFTVSPEHQEKFEKKLKSKIAEYESELGVEYQISFSQQKKSTDTIAVDLDNNPFVEDERLLFRPAGHGALLENLNDLDADILFVKNIDNVVPDRLKAETITYKKALAGLLLEFQVYSFDWQKRIEAGEDCLSEAVEILRSEYAMQLNLQSVEDLSNYLNRPIRVCGMVENTGEPGGGPFWIEDVDGSSLQIAETAQIDLTDAQQEAIFKNSSHFNPVDLVCGVRDYKGEKFDLLRFRNEKTGFITKKSRNGRQVKAMELPGLWNGAMANWITLFVEVPISTFNPVKTVNDLLKPTHQ